MAHAEQGIELLAELAKENVRLLITKGRTVLLRSSERGIKPLLEALESVPCKRLRGAVVADAVVGKASALLMAYADVAFVASKIMSNAGADVLQMREIAYCAQKIVPAILGSNTNQQCPFEQAIRHVTDPREALKVLSELARGLSRGA